MLMAYSLVGMLFVAGAAITATGHVLRTEPAPARRPSTDAATKPGMPVSPTSRTQSSRNGWRDTPKARQTASALDRESVESEVEFTGRSGIFKSVNFAVLSPGQ